MGVTIKINSAFPHIHRHIAASLLAASKRPDAERVRVAEARAEVEAHKSVKHVPRQPTLSTGTVRKGHPLDVALHHHQLHPRAAIAAMCGFCIQTAPVLEQQLDSTRIESPRAPIPGAHLPVGLSQLPLQLFHYSHNGPGDTLGMAPRWRGRGN